MKRNYRQRAEFVVQSIRDLGIDPPRESRLMKMHDLICVEAACTSGTISPEHPKFDSVVESLRDFQLLEFVFDQLRRANTSKPSYGLIKKLVKDSVLSHLDKRDSWGRDAQFELYVFSLCVAADMQPVQLEEPDVTCFLKGKKYAIAAKRVKSLSKLERRVRQGSSQVSRSSLPGIVALDTCLMLNPGNLPITENINDQQFWAVYKSFIHSFTDNHHRQFCQWTRNQGVMGIILHDHQIRYDHESSWGLASITFTIPVCDVNSREYLEFMSFKERYIDGIPDCDRQ